MVMRRGFGGRGGIEMKLGFICGGGAYCGKMNFVLLAYKSNQPNKLPHNHKPILLLNNNIFIFIV